MTGQKCNRAPLASVGLPVYNGERYLALALDSLLAQDFDDFELIVCDNASTDATGDIITARARSDRRVRYLRSETNIGPEANFNRTFQEARGRYFRWAAHDDLVAPDHLRRCIERLEATPDAVLAQSWVRIIDPAGAELGVYDGGLAKAESDRPDERLSAVLCRHLATHVFGVIRSEALRRTRLLRPYYGSDRALLAELALLGRFVHVTEPLFLNREHPNRGSRASGSHRNSGRIAAPAIWQEYADIWRATARHLPRGRVRRVCRARLLPWWFRDWNLVRLIVDISGRRYPWVYHAFDSAKRRLYGPLPQIGLGRECRPPHRAADAGETGEAQGCPERSPDRS